MGMFLNKVHGRDTGVVVNTCCRIKSPVFVMGVRVFNKLYTTLTNFSMKYLVMCMVYSGVGGIK